MTRIRAMVHAPMSAPMLVPAPVGVSQPTVSHHLKVLTDAGILTRDKRGTWAYYALADPSLADHLAALGPRPTR